MSATVVIEGDKSCSGAVVWEGARVRSRRVHAGPLPCADRRARLFSVKTSPRHLVPGSSECARNRDGLAGSGEPGQGQAGPGRAGPGRGGSDRRPRFLGGDLCARSRRRSARSLASPSTTRKNASTCPGNRK